MTTLGGYDPYAHAERLGIAVVEGRLRHANGLWVPEKRLIILKAGMRRLLERSVLAHELGHVCLGHQDDSPRNERQADRFAARHLITDDLLRQAVKQSPDPAQWCHELDVTPHILNTYLRDNRLIA
jgi:Zn-dependent peptidase ImmA (M78 family)